MPENRLCARSASRGRAQNPAPATLASTAKTPSAIQKLVLIGVGGVSSGEDAWTTIRAGASLVQLYTALVYEGPALIGRIKQELLACMERDKIKSIQDATGLDA